MFTDQILTREIVRAKRVFDPSKKKDRELAYKFLETYNWQSITDNGLCPFVCEWPFVEIPAMLKDKLVRYYSKKR